MRRSMLKTQPELVKKEPLSSVQPELRPLFLFAAAFGVLGGIEKFNQTVISSWRRIFPNQFLDIIVQEDPKGSYSLSDSNISCLQLRTRPRLLGKIRFVLATIRVLASKKNNLIICGHVRLALSSWVLSKIFRVPFVTIIHGAEAVIPLSSWVRGALMDSISIWSSSRNTVQICASVNQIPTEKFCLLPPASDTEWFRPGPVSERMAEKYHAEVNTLLLTVARLDPTERHKGIDTTIRALPLILAKYPHLLYLVVGGGGDKERLAGIADEVGVADRVIFTGAASDKELLEYYRIADCFVMPSDEGFGIVYLEALLCGVPVISGDKDGSEQPLQGGRVGWRVNRFDPIAVAHACLEALSGEDQRCQSHWLREETKRRFGSEAFERTLKQNVVALFKEADPKAIKP